ncbi:MAG: ribonuclease R [Bdellovibrionales bacterium]|nr:ribonuclease R [Bdellovibrionales bacterium]
MKTYTLDGLVKRHPDGFGFFIPNDPEHEDVYIGRSEMQGVMTNDKVQVSVFRSGDSDRFHGKILKILERGTKRIVGRFRATDRGAGQLLEAASQMGTALRIPADSTRGAKDGELVAVDITKYPNDESGTLEGKVIEVIGNAEDPINDVKRVAHLQQIPTEFSAAALREADSLPSGVTPEEIQGRQDLRDLPLITIDGVTAKDFDDAIYVKTSPKGFHLWVAIADVSHYVRPGHPMDKDAYERGTSTYFPNFVIPMLPEKISNELCSLKPLVDRLCFVCEMQIDFQGTVVDHKIYEAVMHSQARVTYGEAQEIIEGQQHHKNPAVEKNIKTAADLAKVLMTKRFREGSLELEVPETQVVVNAEGFPTDIIRSQRVFAHRLIEELMLIANVTVAKHLHDAEIPALYRIHEPPDSEDIDKLQRFLSTFGSSTKMGSSQLQKKLTKALQEFHGKPEGIVLNILTLRSMMQAKYTGNNVGHFGLGFEYYTHFTSPIRRYPDLIVHRLLKSLTMRAYKTPPMDEEYISTSGTMLSAYEQRSVKAERQVISIKKARFMQEHLGEVFEGVVSSVVKFGVFVLLRQFDVDGLLKVDQLGDDIFEFDEDALILKGRRTGKTYKIGDVLEVQVARANTDEGQIDFVLEGGSLDDSPRRPAHGTKSYGKSKGKRQPEQSAAEREKNRKRSNDNNPNRKDKKWAGKKSGGKSKDRDRDRDRDRERNRDRDRSAKAGDKRSPKFHEKPSAKSAAKSNDRNLQRSKKLRSVEDEEKNQKPVVPEKQRSAFSRFFSRKPAEEKIKEVERFKHNSPVIDVGAQKGPKKFNLESLDVKSGSKPFKASSLFKASSRHTERPGAHKKKRR